MSPVAKLFLNVLTISLFTGIAGIAGGDQSSAAADRQITVYKTPTCGCCQAWVEYLQDNGFVVISHDLLDLSAIKRDNGLRDARLHSCHTAIVDGYVVEGHVPVSDIQRLLAEKPAIVGLSAPGMPQMSPGMASLEPKGYDVLSFDENNTIRLFSRY